MGEITVADDGLLAEEVGIWAKDKHTYLLRYVDISRAARRKFIGPDDAGATFIDLFCGPGRSRVRKTGEWIEGGCVAAWRKSVAGGAPFSKVYVADADDVRRTSASDRLRRLGAPVIEVAGNASQAAAWIARNANPHALHFAFVDPYNLGSFEFSIIKALARLKRIDMLVHVSKMDLQRNLGLNLASQLSAFDHFAPGWRSAVNMNTNQSAIRRGVFEYWRGLVATSGLAPSADMKLITGSKGQHLYWLLLAARHELAHKFWSSASMDAQGSLFS